MSVMGKSACTRGDGAKQRLKGLVGFHTLVEGMFVAIALHAPHGFGCPRQLVGIVGIAVPQALQKGCFAAAQEQLLCIEDLRRDVQLEAQFDHAARIEGFRACGLVHIELHEQHPAVVCPQGMGGFGCFHVYKGLLVWGGGTEALECLVQGRLKIVPLGQQLTHSADIVFHGLVLLGGEAG